MLCVILFITVTLILPLRCFFLPFSYRFLLLPRVLAWIVVPLAGRSSDFYVLVQACQQFEINHTLFNIYIDNFNFH